VEAMPDIDLSKAVAVLTDLFGPRRGRLIAIGLVSLACVAAALFLWWIIWDYGGRAVFAFVSDLLTKAITGTDLTAAAATLIWAALIYGLAFVAVLYFLGRALLRRSVPQSVLDELARLRNEGIRELFAASRPKDDDEFADWKRRYQDWTGRLLNFVKINFPEADFLSLEYLGILEGRGFTNVYNAEHDAMKGHPAKRIEIIEQILASYRG
jgi:hypothetical protein